ncbi:uncharacterized protein F4817DRAFT_264049 [Daldinia loculata]|uniref:uncharacterized protein n=1 Tax=Daldinia loculata TaxID=103429 RepID=UPI0020C26AB8|nr:uncharacterized protein F4817DRAFT_264049 [Daldinia loculata]KAI1650545.1 hypothetical protein F4817DRAFT_264049 [Daldinia loculata]
MRRHCANSKLAGEGNYPDIQAARPNTIVDLRSTVDYHNSLLDQARQQHELAQPPKAHSHRGHSGPNHHSLSSLRQWLGTTVNSNSTVRKKTNRNERDQLNYDMTLPPHPHLTRKEIEEFEALPIAIRRKYFSTLERLRLAQTVGVLDPSSPPDKELRRHHQRRGASLSAIVPGRPLERPTTSPTCQDNVFSADCAFLAKLPAKIREKHLTREEQVLVARQLRQSVILDAADEAFFKAGRLANRRPSPPPVYPPTLSSSERPSMESLLSDNASAGKRDSLYDSFRWLDEEEDLNLRLALDDYHVNLRESVPMAPKDPRSPSFRRHMSFSKVPFGRTSISSRPGTKDAQQPPPSANSTSATSVGFPQPGRRKSRALSLITPKHAAYESISSIDPGATHYQDPEARLKLRVYLASPQKFDEAIEFGFPSSDSSAIPYRDLPSAKGQSDGIFSPDSEKFKTFLEDDKSSIYSDDASLPDPESPRTPDTLDKHDKSLQRPRTNDYPSRLPETYAQVPAASREMTLRMTLTRPDLRACEDNLYGWQQAPRPYSSKPSQVLAFRDDAPTSAPYTSHGAKESMDKIFADIDHELGLPTPTDSNVVKRFWNRVRRV